MIRAAYLFIYIISICFSSAAAADNANPGQPVSVKAEVNRSSVSIGDRIEYTITVNAPKDYEVRLPDFGETLADFSVKDFHSDEGGLFSRTYTQSYTLDIYETGTFTIPAAVIRYKDGKDAEWKEAAAEEISITVQSLLDNAESSPVIKDIKGPYSISSLTYLYILIAAAVLIAIAVALYFYMKKRKGPAKISAPPPPPAHETALRALKELMEKNYIKTGRVQEYYFELSNIVRHYLEDRFYLKAPEMTTEEFLAHVKDTGTLSNEHKRLLREFLSHCDMVKFAKHLPGDTEIESSYSSAEKLVEQTKEKPLTGEAVK